MPWPFKRKQPPAPTEVPPAPQPKLIVNKPEPPAVFVGPFISTMTGPIPEEWSLPRPVVASLPNCTAALGFRLLNVLSRDASAANLFFSPASIAMCLGMAWELASGETRREFAKALEFTDSETAKVRKAFLSVNQAFRDRTNTTVSMANGLWCSPSVSLASESSAGLQANFAVEFTTADFSDPGVAARINAWVESKTRGRIDGIVDDLTPETLLAAINAIYFKGLWMTPFSRQWTRDGLFTTSAGTQKQLPMMQQSGKFPYFENEKLQAIALHYNDEIALQIVLPAEGISSHDFQQSLTTELWQSWLAKFGGRTGTIELPRFKADYGASLVPALSGLGIQRAFHPTTAEFAGLRCDQAPLYIDRVVHKAVVEITEEGTEAAAATGFTAFFGYEAPVPRFRMVVNRPFFVAIYDASTGTVLFMGWIGDPQ